MTLLSLVFTLAHSGGWSESIWLGDYEANDCIEIAHVMSGAVNDNASYECEPVGEW